MNGLSSGVRRIPAWVWGLLVVGILIGLNAALSNFQRTVLTEMLIAGLFALSLNLIMGYGGMVHFGHAAFYGIGGYTVAIGALRLGINPVLLMLLAPVVSGVLALVIGWFAVRRVSLYFSILTLAFSQLVYIVIFQSRDITNGDDGMHGIQMPVWLNDPSNYLLFTIAVVAVCVAILYLITRSPFALVLRAIRENPERALFIGVNVRRHQLLVFVIGGIFAGVAGALLVGEKRFAGVEMLFWTAGAEPILASLLGGMFAFSGPLIGGALLTFLNITLTRFTPYWPLVLGILTVTIVLVTPTGLVGLAQRLFGGNRGEEGGV